MFAAHPLVYVPLEETGAFLIPHKIAIRWSAVLRSGENSGKPYLVEKTPRHIRCLNAIRNHVPSAKVVMMVRDGLDVVASLLKRHGNIEIGVDRWIKDNEIVACEQNAQDTFLLRYEDLISSPQEELKRCCDFIGIPYDPVMLCYHDTKRLWFGETEIREGSGKNGSEHKALRNWQINQPLFDGRGRWRHLLSSEQVEAVRCGAMSPLAARLGYSWD